MTQTDVLIIALATCFFMFLCVMFLALVLTSTRTDLKNTQEDYAQREASWRSQQNPERRSRSDIQLVTGMFDEKRVRQIMREQEET